MSLLSADPAICDGASEFPPRFAIVCGKRVGKAPVRNKVRRRIREICRLTLVSMLPNGSQVVIRALPASAVATYADLEQELVTSLQRLLRKLPSVGGPVEPNRAEHAKTSGSKPAGWSARLNRAERLTKPQLEVGGVR